MKDKEMIEEMARDIARKDCHLFENCPKEHKYNCISQDPNIMIESSKNYITIATWLISEGWVKPPKDIVTQPTIQSYSTHDNDLMLISRKEYEKLKLELAIEKKRADESYTQKEVEEIIASKERIKSKETATKFYDKFNENISCFELDSNLSENYKEGYAQSIADICGKLDKTAVELGVDLKEYYGK